MDGWIFERVEKANNLAKKARAAALAGEEAQAEQLRNQLDQAWDSLFQDLEQADSNVTVSVETVERG